MNANLHFSRRCNAAGCNGSTTPNGLPPAKPAKWTPVIKIWARGYSHETSKPVRIEVSMGFCDEHKDYFKIEDIPDLGAVLTETCRQMRLAAPDVEHPELEMKPILAFGNPAQN